MGIIILILLNSSLFGNDTQRDWLHRMETSYPLEIPNLSHNFDVLHYDIKITEINFNNHSLRGEVGIKCLSKMDGLSEITLHLARLDIDSITMGGEQLSYIHSSDTLHIKLGRVFNTNEKFEIRIRYHGNPGNEGPGGFGGFWFIRGVAFSMGVGLKTIPPSMARYWFPCFDEPYDKATFDLYFTVPEGKTAVSNGELVETIKNQGKVTYHWRENHPVSTYLISVSVSDYIKIDDPYYDWISYYVYPQDSAKAVKSFKNVHKMMDCFTQLFSPYHFEKFSYVAAPKGDMEHVTCVTHNARLINGKNNYDWILAHELSHQWWGDWVTIKDWRDIWLNEGFATYSEALYQEYAYGEEAYHKYVDTSLMDYYLRKNEFFPIYDPENLWSATTYEKGACVLHMLRHIVGDSIFFQILRRYGEEYAYSNATTYDFQRVCEEVSGKDLNWFFQEWVYDWGYPIYEYGWKSSKDTVRVLIRQVQKIGPIFKMPIDLKFNDTTITVWVDKDYQKFHFVLSSPPTRMEFDPENWILKKVKEVPYGILESRPSAKFYVLKIYPNPFKRVTSIKWIAADEEPISLKIYNTAGKLVKILAKTENLEPKTYVVWDGRDEKGRLLPSGVYFCRLEIGDYKTTGKIVFLNEL